MAILAVAIIYLLMPNERLNRKLISVSNEDTAENYDEVKDCFDKTYDQENPVQHDLVLEQS